MREKPTLRIPLGILGLMIGLLIYAFVIANFSSWIGQLHVLLQTVIYVIAGTIWLLPLKNFLIWMETGKWGVRPETKADDS